MEEENAFQKMVELEKEVVARAEHVQLDKIQEYLSDPEWVQSGIHFIDTQSQQKKNIQKSVVSTVEKAPVLDSNGRLIFPLLSHAYCVGWFNRLMNYLATVDFDTQPLPQVQQLHNDIVQAVRSTPALATMPVPSEWIGFQQYIAKRTA